MITAGVGVTPFKCMIEHAAEAQIQTEVRRSGRRVLAIVTHGHVVASMALALPSLLQIALFLAAPSLEEIPWREDLLRTAAAARNASVHFRLTRPADGWDGPVGYFDAATIGALVAEYGHSGRPKARTEARTPGAVWYISGPPKMVGGTHALLTQAGVPLEDIRTESFRSATYDADAALQATRM
jgi:ferredoxin-NADP reductase